MRHPRYNKYTQIAARALRASLKEEERVAAEKRGLTVLRYQRWEKGQGGPQVSSKPRSVFLATLTDCTSPLVVLYALNSIRRIDCTFLSTSLDFPRSPSGRGCSQEACGLVINVRPLGHGNIEARREERHDATITGLYRERSNCACFKMWNSQRVRERSTLTLKECRRLDQLRSFAVPRGPLQGRVFRSGAPLAHP